MPQDAFSRYSNELSNMLANRNPDVDIVTTHVACRAENVEEEKAVPFPACRPADLPICANRKCTGPKRSAPPWRTT